MAVPRSIGDEKVVLASGCLPPLNTIPHGVHGLLRVKGLLCRVRWHRVRGFPGALVFNRIEGEGTVLRNASSS